MHKKIKKNRKTEIIKIPNNITVFWCEEKKIIVLKGPLKQKSLKIHRLISIYCVNQQIELVIHNSKKLSNNNTKKIYSLQKTTTSLLRQLLIETAAIMYQKLKLVGVGYRAFPVKNFENQLLMLKLGYSHPIYFKVPLNTDIFCLKLTQLFLYGNSYQKTTFTASKIRLHKTPEPYKGKGILYDNETIILKEGKKI